MLMLATRTGGYIAFNAIARIFARKDLADGGSVANVETIRGDKVEVSGYALDRLLQSPVNTWPAQPGTYVLDFDEESDTAGQPPLRTPVIGWCRTLEGFVEPVTVNGVNDDRPGVNLKVLMPDGMVVNPCCASWASEYEFVRDMRAAVAGRVASGPDDSAPTS